MSHPNQYTNQISIDIETYVPDLQGKHMEFTFDVLGKFWEVHLGLMEIGN